MQLVLRGLLVPLDPQAPLVHKDQKETLAQPELQETQVLPALRGPLVQLDRPGCKVLLARVEGLTASRSFRAAAFLWFRLASRV